ncbi:MAG: 3-dehydroquinate dehydratase [Actinomycetota bacterium]|nr:3-dehydroquinate dehydratase [Actinomycetota bacterium]
MTGRSLLLLSGPNLNLLGEREPEMYGTQTLDDLVAAARTRAAGRGLDLVHLQSNSEADLVEAVQAARGKHVGIVVNAGALTHYGWSLHDALATYDGVIIELHLTNPAARESWRHLSVLAPVARGTIAGVGAQGYELAIDAAATILEAT